ncbi:hypothetical protein [Paraburkholderia nodosa]|uniref:hypothetical protein n=1 Tax=Paraburkholderia nodosa TaxID=392320 RepID=UPI0012B6A6F5|nr:hypothetical protein [Paraburkholderia nodosa]
MQRNTGLLPEQFAGLVFEQYEKAANAAFRDDAESVIDRCREAATAALNAERLRGSAALETNAKDLVPLGKICAAKGREVLGNVASILATLQASEREVVSRADRSSYYCTFRSGRRSRALTA